MFEIELIQAEEQLWLGAFPELGVGWSTKRENCQVELFRSLAKRDAIPKHRMMRFMDKHYNPGGYGKSIKEGFESNGCRGEDILRSTSFSKFLRYFVLGPDIEELAASEFMSFLDGLMKPFTSSDIEPVRRKAREIARKFGSSRADRNKYFELALEANLPLSVAVSVRDAVGQINK